MQKIITKRKNGTIRVQTRNEKASMTDQSQAEETNANYIIKKFNKTRDISLLKQRAGQYADMSEIGDLGEALNKISEAKSAFATLPAVLRKRFGNNPQEFIDYMNDAANHPEAVKLGLMIEREPENLANSPSPANPPKKTGKKQPDLPIEDD